MHVPWHSRLAMQGVRGFECSIPSTNNYTDIGITVLV